MSVVGNILELSADEARSLGYSKDLRRDLTIVEIPPEILEDVLLNGAELKGGADQPTVFCTRDKTFPMLKIDHQFHKALIAPKEVGEAEDVDVVIKGIAASEYEVIDGTPSLAPILDCMLENPYCGDDLENLMDVDDANGVPGRLYTFEDLRQKIQASTGEIVDYLRELGAFEIDGYWRILDDGYLGIMIDMIKYCAAEKEWDLRALPRAELEHVMRQEGYVNEVLHHCMSLIAKDEVAQDASKIWAVQENKISIHYARRILGNKDMDLQEFLRLWEDRVPHVFEPKIEMLLGEALIDTNLQIIKIFRKDRLPKECHDRFKTLFAIRQFWEQEELKVYMADAKFPHDWDLDYSLYCMCAKYYEDVDKPFLYCAKPRALNYKATLY